MEGNGLPPTAGRCCDGGYFGTAHDCRKQPGRTLPELAAMQRNGAGIERDKLHASPGRPRGARNLHAKHPSSLAKRLKRAGVDWVEHFAQAIKNRERETISMWLQLLPYLVTTTNKVRVKRWKGRASRAALIALETLEGKKQ